MMIEPGVLTPRGAAETLARDYRSGARAWTQGSYNDKRLCAGIGLFRLGGDRAILHFYKVLGSPKVPLEPPAPPPGRVKAYRAICQIAAWNDHLDRTQEQVLERLDQAAKTEPSAS